MKTQVHETTSEELQIYEGKKKHKSVSVCGLLSHHSKPIKSASFWINVTSPVKCHLQLQLMKRRKNPIRTTVGTHTHTHLTPTSVCVFVQQPHE